MSSRGFFMMDTGYNESQQAQVENAEMDLQKVSGLGALLKAEREKKSLSHEQVAQITRLRRHFVEALENEDWNNLPPSVFVKGFIRSYAKALGLDERKALNLYQSMVPGDSEVPKPLVEPSKRKKWRLLIPILLLAVIAVTVYVWQVSPPGEKAPIQIKEGSPIESHKVPAVKPEPTALESETIKVMEEEKGSVTMQIPSGDLEETEKSKELLTEEEKIEYPTDEYLFTEATTEPATPVEWQVLKATVNARTWIRIYIDDKKPKEYILEPGSRPQWKAREGFNMLIGNAAGIEFDFNGKKIGNLGALGQVVKVRLPEDFRVAGFED